MNDINKVNNDIHQLLSEIEKEVNKLCAIATIYKHITNKIAEDGGKINV
jgi:hypothetical protein